MSTTENKAQFYYNHTEAGYYTNATLVDHHATDTNEDGTPFVMPPPYLATLKPIPAVPEHKWPKMVNDEWVLVDNWVGFTYWLADRTCVTIKEFEVSPPEGYLTEDPGPSLADVQEEKTYELRKAYVAAMYENIEFKTAGGVTAAFQADAPSRTSLDSALSGFPDEVPADYFWLDAENTRVPVTRVDLVGLRTTISTRDFALFTKYQDLKALVTLAKTKEEVAELAW